jgi:uncharacterized membrane protein (DUF373 family)
MAGPKRVLTLADTVVKWVELAAAIVLVALAIVTVVFVVVDMGALLTKPAIGTVQASLGNILLVFILVELYGITTEFIRGGRVVDKVFELGMVALVRQVIVSEFLYLKVDHLLALAALILALGIAWYLSHRQDGGSKGAEGQG